MSSFHHRFVLQFFHETQGNAAWWAPDFNCPVSPWTWSWKAQTFFQQKLEMKPRTRGDFSWFYIVL